MAFRERVEKRLHEEEKEYETEQLMKEKRSEEYEVLEEVFDRSTLMVIYGFMNSGVIDRIYGVVKAGKEARVYWGKDKTGKELAIKIYLTVSAEFRKGMLKYIEGDPRFRNVKRDTRSLIFAWAQKEFKNLEQALAAKVRVPKPIAVRNNVLVMEFIGKNGVSAPSMKEQPPTNPERTYKILISYLERLYRKAELVHGDLSEYNIMIWKGLPVLFDMSQAVPPSHPMADFLLNRDISNLNRFFSRLGVNILPAEEVYRMVTGHGSA
ncbi:MAG: serine protein kinase RIO [Candidatus Bathyarchaeota archaeon]|nr:serine protein kinase RIO [Candidatus Bathyarchaeota archaeon]MDW8040870.1 serine protein kinase RIO [Nitrososphaerota archaeon]